jgi:hypothetical protein
MWPGWAVACVIVSRLANPLRPALAVVDGAVDEASNCLLELAAGLRINVGVEAWSPTGDALDSNAHLDRLASLIDCNGGGSVTLATDGGQLSEMLAAAGPIRAWT